MFITYFFIPSTILILSIFLLIYLYYERSFKYWSNRYVPHPKPSFPFGNFNRNMMSESGKTIQEIYNELKKTRAKYGGYYMLGMPVFMPLNPELYKEVLIKNFQSFHDLGIYYDEENDPLSANLPSLTGAKWRYIRSKLSPAFSSTKLKMILTIMKETSNDIVNIVDKSKEIDIYDLAAGYTTDVICSCAFGIDGNNLNNPNTVFREYGRKLMGDLGFLDAIRLGLGIMAPQILKIFNLSIFNPKYTKFFYKVARETVEYREKNNVKRNDLMDLLIRLKNNENIEDEDAEKIDTEQNKDEKGFTLNQIAAQVFIFFLAGFETTSMALTMCMYELARHPDIQQKVREEILKVIEENDGEITYEAINNMHYTDKVIQETVRMYPPITMLNRIVTQRYQLPDSSIILEEGTRVVISTLGVHYDPQFYPQPDRFDPERFSEQEKAKRPSMTYFPFGDGPRICIGQKFAMIEIKLALAQFLRNFKYSLHPSTKPKIETVTYAHLLGLKDKILLIPTKM